MVSYMNRSELRHQWADHRRHLGEPAGLRGIDLHPSRPVGNLQRLRLGLLAAIEMQARIDAEQRDAAVALAYGGDCHQLTSQLLPIAPRLDGRHELKYCPASRGSRYSS